MKQRLFVMVTLSLILMLAILPQFSMLVQGTERVVRVGWYESPFNTTDELGRRSGYAYEYQQKIAAYTGWTYEYVQGSWSELMQMLVEGKIDLMSDVSYTEERRKTMLFSALPMGTEEYSLFVASGNGTISAEDYSTLNGKKVGINKGSVMIDLFLDWEKANGVQAQIVELTGSEDANQDKLLRGDIDAYVVLDAFLEVGRMLPICEIGSSDFFFAVSKSQPEILTELNVALNRIKSENPYFNQKLTSKYLMITGSKLFLSAEEKSWLADHGTIRVGYQDNYLAFCAKDTRTGELTGALKDYFAVAAHELENANLSFEAIAYPTADAAMEAMKNGEVDCMFPANLTDYDGEAHGYFMTAPLMRTDMSAVIQESTKQTFFKKGRITVAVNVGNPNYDMFLLDHFPDWRSIYFENTQECLRAIANGKADCLLISNYRYSNIEKLCEKYHLTTVSTGVEMDYCFAVNRSDTNLYSILTKVNSIVPSSTINAALAHYSTLDAKSSIGDLLRQHWGLAVGVFIAVVLLVLFLLLRGARSEKKAVVRQALIAATETDELTGLYNKNYFFEYISRFYHEHPDKPMDAVVLNIEQFHTVNAIYGRAYGDEVLRTLGSEIRAFLQEQEGFGGHVEADSFAIFCSRLEDKRALLDRLQGKLDLMSANASIRLRMGVMPWKEKTEPQQLVEQALIACNLGRGHYNEHLIVFDENVRKREIFEQRLISELPHAIENKEFEVYYQPKFDIQVDPPKLVGAEALVRWQHPEFGLIKPDDFIPLFESDGQIGMLDKYVWSQAAVQVARWRTQYGVLLPVSVNLSRIDVFDSMLEVTLDTLLEENGLDSSVFHLEITESAYTKNATQFINVIEGLRKKGYVIEMDDFGSGYSSLNMLSAMPIDVLKMDKAFIQDIELNDKDVQFVALIMDISKNLNVPVVAEGVETKAQLRLLKQLGCAQVQGFYFSKPLSASEFGEKIMGNHGSYYED